MADVQVSTAGAAAEAINSGSNPTSREPIMGMVVNEGSREPNKGMVVDKVSCESITDMASDENIANSAICSRNSVEFCTDNAKLSEADAALSSGVATEFSSQKNRPLPVPSSEESVGGNVLVALCKILEEKLLGEYIPLLKKKKFLTEERLSFMTADDVAQLQLPLGDRLTLENLTWAFRPDSSITHSSPVSSAGGMSPAMSSQSSWSRTGMATPKKTSPRARTLTEKVCDPPTVFKTKKAQNGMSIAEFYFKIADTLYIEFPSDENYICALCDPVDRVLRPMRVRSEVRKHAVTDIH